MMDFVSFWVLDLEIGREKVSFVFVMIGAAFLTLTFSDSLQCINDSFK